MQLHEIKPKNKARKSRRIGRGGKRGSSSGRGMKGQKSRAGRKFQPISRELIKRYHKLKGYREKPRERNLSFKTVNLEILGKAFSASEKITPEKLLEKGIVAKKKGKLLRVKILGRGEVKKVLNVENCEVSKSAKEKIEKAGGTIK